MYYLFYFSVLALLTLAKNYASFESAVIVALALIVAEVWMISSKLDKR